MADRTHSHDTSMPAMSAETVPSEEAAKLVYEAMVWARDQQPGVPVPKWIDGGNSDAQYEARRVIRKIADLSASHLAKEGGEAGAVEAAYREGHGDALLSSMAVDTAWDVSTAKADLAVLPQPSPALAKGGDAVRERVARIIMENRDDGACLVKDWTVEERENAHVAQALRQADAVLAALSTPTEGPASQTEGMGAGAGLVMARRLLDPDDRLGPPQPLTFPNAEWCEEYAKWHRRAVSYALTPPETAEAVPVASDPAPAGEAVEPPEGALPLRVNAATPNVIICANGNRISIQWREQISGRPDLNEYARAEAMAAFLVQTANAHPAPKDTARLREELERVTRELAEENQNAQSLASDLSGLMEDFSKCQRERDDARKALEMAAQALETAAGRFNMMGGVGLVNGADPKAGYTEAYEACRVVHATLATETSR